MEINNIAFLLETYSDEDISDNETRYLDTDSDDEDNETWRTIRGYVDYQVSSFGQIKKTSTNKILKPSKQHGYYSIILIQDRIYKKYYVHRLVCRAFCTNLNNYLMVDHIDRNKSNNNYINLRWASASINQRNRMINTNNTSGVHGVSFNQNNNSWFCQWYNNLGEHKSKSFWKSVV